MLTLEGSGEQTGEALRSRLLWLVLLPLLFVAAVFIALGAIWVRRRYRLARNKPFILASPLATYRKYRVDPGPPDASHDSPRESTDNHSAFHNFVVSAAAVVVITLDSEYSFHKVDRSTMARIFPSQREDFVVIWHLFGHHVGSKLLAGTPEEPVVSLLADERPEAVGCDDLTTRSCLATSPTDEPLRGRPGKELIPLSLATFDCRHLLDSIVWFASSLRRTSTTSGKSGGTTLRDGTGPRAREQFGHVDDWIIHHLSRRSRVGRTPHPSRRMKSRRWPVVKVVYSRDSESHVAAVSRLCELLRRELGFRVEWDEAAMHLAHVTPDWAMALAQLPCPQFNSTAKTAPTVKMLVIESDGALLKHQAYRKHKVCLSNHL
ncbi:hypothetical protein HPB51_012302 [Rhipicephalus microplus]|uniref:Uncharacterized protein n=1 Tax=Rhipicephalus microplus TaxID=6941 RepID=A0A9J6E9K5_RHIMP|nr:hypothetical protein HPB51_012302 [Rhipicephalus microplus]